MAHEIEKSVQQVMDEDSKVRKKVKEMTMMARKAIENGGSSLISIGRLIKDMVANNQCSKRCLGLTHAPPLR